MARSHNQYIKQKCIKLELKWRTTKQRTCQLADSDSLLEYKPVFFVCAARTAHFSDLIYNKNDLKCPSETVTKLTCKPLGICLGLSAIPKVNETPLGSRAFSYQPTIICNHTLTHIREACSVDSFKNENAQLASTLNPSD